VVLYKDSPGWIEAQERWGFGRGRLEESVEDAYLPAIFDEVAEQMRSDLRMARFALQHPGLKGSSFENTFRKFLRQYLPKNLDVSTGVLVDAQGNPASRQMDVIISDAAKTPIFYLSGDIRVVPIECVYSIIEIKAYLDSNELNRAFQNMLSVRRLQKTAYSPQGDVYFPAIMYGQEWEIWQTNYFLFAFDSIGLAPLADALQEKHAGASLPPHQRIDSVCVLDKGLILNKPLEEEMVEALPSPGSVLRLAPTRRALLMFYVMISKYLNQARMPDFRLGAYVQGVDWIDPTIL
jgi:hypothetical protein